MPYTLRNTPARELAKEMVRLRVNRPPITERLTRANTGIRNIYLKSVGTDTTRKEIEEADVAEQCVNVLKEPINGVTKCWLCGFHIRRMSITETPSNYFWSRFMDEVVCEHVLPVRLAGVITGLYTSSGGYSAIGDDHLLHSVYEYAHIFCNLAKSNMWFITKPNKSTQNFCDLEVNEEKIRYFLDYLLNYRRTPTGRPPYKEYKVEDKLIQLFVDSHESRIFSIENNQPQVVAVNLVQYYISQDYAEPGRTWDEMVRLWKENQFEIIKEKTKRLIEKIKVADSCTEEGVGSLYAASMKALRDLELHGHIPKLIGPSRPIFARSPSIESINRALTTSGRLHPRLFPKIVDRRTLAPITELDILQLAGLDYPQGNILKRVRTGRQRRRRFTTLKKKRGKKSRGKR